MIEYETELKRRQRIWYRPESWTGEAVEVVYVKKYPFERSALLVIELPNGSRVAVHRSSVFVEKP